MSGSLLLDGNALVWWATDSPRLSQASRNAIEDPASELYLSTATVWELEIKRAAGKLAFDVSAWACVPARAFDLLPIEFDDALEAARLPLHHRDPFDRMIVAQALNRDLTIVTGDGALEAYGVSVLMT